MSLALSHVAKDEAENNGWKGSQTNWEACSFYWSQVRVPFAVATCKCVQMNRQINHVASQEISPSKHDQLVPAGTWFRVLHCEGKTLLRRRQGASLHTLSPSLDTELSAKLWNESCIASSVNTRTWLCENCTFPEDLLRAFAFANTLTIRFRSSLKRKAIRSG